MFVNIEIKSSSMNIYFMNKDGFRVFSPIFQISIANEATIAVIFLPALMLTVFI